jgi:hypothetical protein
MSSHRAVPVALAIVAGVYPTVLAIAGVPLLLIFGMASLSESLAVAASFFAASALGLLIVTNYWYLAVKTVRGRPYGPLWVLALISACNLAVSAVALYKLGADPKAALVILYVTLWCYFLWMQCARIRPAIRRITPLELSEQ